MDEEKTKINDLNHNPGSTTIAYSGLSGPIIVTEDENYYKVKIHFNDKEIVKAIQGRQWNATERKWFFKKNESTYEALTQKLQEIANKFVISKPTYQNNVGIMVDYNPFEETEIDASENEVIDREEVLNMRLSGIETNINSMNSKISESVHKLDSILMPILANVDPLTGDILNKEKEDLNKEEKISFDAIVNNLISLYPEDEFNLLFKDNNFSIEHPADLVQTIHNRIQLELINLIPIEEYKKACENTWEEYDKNPQTKRKAKGSREDYKLTMSELIHFVRKNRFLHYDPNKPDAFKLIQCANNLRNRILKSNKKEGLAKNLQIIYTINFILLTRIAWDRIVISE
tara:strand:+ start:69 stop:1103 length:1035 start_codon:yes stop_codon:yes gene_type:complete